MCASGLPIRIGNRHVVEITNMALAIRASVQYFKIRHLPLEALRVRIGLHSGLYIVKTVMRYVNIEVLESLYKIIIKKHLY